MTIDPLTKVYDAVCLAFRSNAKGRFRLIDHNSTRNPVPDSPMAADLPEVQIRPTSKSVVLGARSCATVVVQEYQVTIVTGDFILGKILFPVEWHILAILHSLQYSLVEELDLAEDVSVAQITEGIAEPIGSRNIVGWASSWTISVHMAFAASELLEL